MSTFINEPLLELRRAPVRETLVDALAALDQQLPWRVPGADRRRAPRRPDLRIDRPWRPRAGRRAGDRGHPRRRRRRGADRCRMPHRHGRIAALMPAPRSSRVPPASCAGAARCWPRWPSASARSRGRRPTPTSARRSTSSSTTRSRRSRSSTATGSSSCPASATRSATPRAASSPSIGPWNFPLAIPCGMVAAGLATGNGVVLKPAEQSPACAFAVVEALLRRGRPRGRHQLPPRRGRRRRRARRPPRRAHDRVHRLRRGRPGDPQAQHRARPRPAPPQARRGRDGRQELRDRRRRRRPRRRRPRPRLLAPSASPARSAARRRRALVHERIADALLERLHGAVEALLVDQAQRFGVDVPPVIEPATQERVARYLQIARDEGARVFQPGERARARPLRRARGRRRPAARQPRRRGGDLRPAARGPARRATSTRRATIVSDQPFALTGGLFSRDPATVERVSRALPVGNLYVNRHITGAMVARQPFGGNRLSGHRHARPAAPTTCCTSSSRAW